MHLISALVLAVTATAAPPPARSGAPAVVVWSTYLRNGPGAAFPALDEVEHDTRVVRLGCAGGWCRVRTAAAEGYVDQSALQLTAPPVTGGPDCRRVRLADDTGPPFTRLCGPGPSPPASVPPSLRR